MQQKSKYIKYSKAELESYVQNEESCVRKINVTKVMGLQPWALGNLNSSVHHLISKNIGKYNRDSEGIILDYCNTKVLNNKSIIRHDSSELQVNIQTDYYVFQPVIGAIITGTIKHIALNHIGVIIYRVFNVSIRLNDFEKSAFHVKQEIKFKIKKFDFQNLLPYIVGELIDAPTSQIDSDYADSGISTGETKTNKQNQPDCSPISSKIKQEKKPNILMDDVNDSDSSSESQHSDTKEVKSILRNIKREKSISIASSSDSESEQENCKIQVKLEKQSNISSKSETESEDDNETESTMTGIQSAPVKIEENSNILTSEKNIKKEPEISQENIYKTTVLEPQNHKRQREDSTSSNSSSESTINQPPPKKEKGNTPDKSFRVPKTLETVTKKINFSDSDSSTPTKKRIEKSGKLELESTQNLAANLLKNILSEKSSSEAESSGSTIKRKKKRIPTKSIESVSKVNADEVVEKINVTGKKDNTNPKKPPTKPRKQIKEKIEILDTSALVDSLLKSMGKTNAFEDLPGTENATPKKKIKKVKTVQSLQKEDMLKTQKMKEKDLEDLPSEKKDKSRKNKNVSFNETINTSILDISNVNHSISDDIFENSEILSTPLLSSTMKDVPEKRKRKKKQITEKPGTALTTAELTKIMINQMLNGTRK